MKYDSFGDPQEIAHEILAYLAENPDAQDTLQGIAEWWLLQRRIQHHLAQVGEAIQSLVSVGFLIEHSGSYSDARYQVNRKKLAEIRKLLGEQLQ